MNLLRQSVGTDKRWMRKEEKINLNIAWELSSRRFSWRTLPEERDNISLQLDFVSEKLEEPYEKTLNLWNFLR